MRRLYADDDLNLQGHHIVDWRWLNDLPTSGAAEGAVLAYVDGEVVWAALSDAGVSSLAWMDIADKPDSFPPVDHEHAVADISNFPSTWAWEDLTGVPSVFPPADHTHSVTEVTDFPTTWAWADLTGVPSEFPPEDHTHSVTDITDYGTHVTSLQGGTGISVNTTTGSVTAAVSLTEGFAVQITGATIAVDSTSVLTGLTAGANMVVSGATIALSESIDVRTVDVRNESGNSPALRFFDDADNLRYWFYMPSTSQDLLRIAASTDGSTIDYDLMVLSNTNRRVGIGTAAPSFDLDVAGNIRATNALISSGNVYINYGGPDAASSLYFYEGGNAGAYLQWDDNNTQFRFNRRLRVDSGTIDLALVLTSSDARVYAQMVDSGGYGNIVFTGNTFYMEPNGAVALTVSANTVQAAGELRDSLSAAQASDLASTTTTAQDTDLSVNARSSATYKFDAIILIQGDDALSTDGSISFDAPTGAALYWHEGLQDGGQINRTTRAPVECNGTSVTLHRVAGILVTGTTAGTFMMDFAQDIANANATNFLAGSCMELRRI